VYPSVRDKGGVCIARFRPPLVLNVRKGPKVTFTFVNADVTTGTVESRIQAQLAIGAGTWAKTSITSSQ
jgi:hypothetical protein